MPQRKDRLIQTRVPEKLETTLKHEAKRRRTTVSQMIRNILEDSFDLVDGVVANVDQIVAHSVELVHQVGRDARRIGKTGQAAVRDLAAPCGPPLSDAEKRLGPIQAWSPVVLNKSVACTKCGARLPRGRSVYTGLGDPQSEPRAWLCASAVESISIEERPIGDPPADVEPADAGEGESVP